MHLRDTFRKSCNLAAILIILFGLFSSEAISDARWLALLGLAWLLLLAGTHIELPDDLPTFNRGTIRTAFVIFTVFVLLAAQLLRIQVVQSDNTFYRTGIAPDKQIIANQRASSDSLLVQRGRIYDRNGIVIADTVEQDGEYFREWPDPATAYVSGYFSPLLYGSSGLEANWNEELTGQSGGDPVDEWLDGLLGRPRTGYDLNLTLDSNLQNTATDLLDGRTGAVVVMDVKTGAVLVLVSSPIYDPNQIFTANQEENDAAIAYWNDLNADGARAPLLVRATDGLYTPGSTFKTITSAIAIEAGVASPDSVYEDDGSLVIDGRELIEFNRPDPGRDQWTLEEGVGWSLNVVLAQVGLDLGAKRMREGAGRFGFGQPVPFDLHVATSQLASEDDYLENSNALADTAFGQGQILVSPLQMAMVASCFANDGKMMQPYLVQTVTNADGEVQETTRPKTWKTPVSASTAGDVRDMMIYAVEQGAIQRASGTGYLLGGKTGTAEIGDGSNNSWFIGFIGESEPEYAVAVVLEKDTSTPGTTTDIATNILLATMQQRP